tara:strand:+ start:9896 stop:11731 length:1836 start_codon:yes stop_codon:yes gene_type:complete
MANIRKSFNFRSGLQVDNDNFVINSNGLVGIGTSIPQNYLLNVYGDKGLRVTGLTTTRDLNVSQNVEISGITTVGVLTASSIDIANGVNVGGTLTAATLKLANGETVDNLIGFARTTFITDNGGVGLHTTSKIGLNTTTSPGASDPELSVIGNVDVTGIITATTFSGNVTGDLNSSGVSTFTELKVGTAITMSAGIITATTFIGNLTGNVTGDVTSGISTFTELKVGTAITMSAGIVTATTFIGNVTGDVTGNVNASSGVSTFTDLKVGTAITMSAGIITATTFIGNVTGTATTATNLTDAANITTGTLSNDRLPVTPQFTSVGIGTASPTDALHIQQSGAAEIYVGSDTNASSLRVGRNLDDNNSGMVKYGNTSGAYPDSTENSLDFMNFGWGNVNFYLQAGITTTSDTNFNWNRGGFSNLMTLTQGGNLGIGITNPSQRLNVQGISTFTGNANFDQDVTIVGALSADSLTLTQSLSANLTGNVTGNLSGNVNTASGISTFNHVLLNKVGIGTTAVSNASLLTEGSVRARTGISIGTTDNPKCAVDMSTIVGINTTSAYMIPPKVTTTQRDGLTNQSSDPLGADEAGATIYNISTNKLQTWNGSTWNDLF